MKPFRSILFAGVVVLGGVSGAAAEVQFSAYGGASVSHDSDVSITSTYAAPYNGAVGWNGESFDAPMYWGIRGIYWFDSARFGELGVALDYAHNKVAAKTVPPGYDTFEFTDGLNTATINLMKRWALSERFYVHGGVGAGIAVPHVELTPSSDPSMRTYEYQLTGPAAQVLLGIDFYLTNFFSLFAEYKGTATWNDADVRGGGAIHADILSHQFILGASVSFGHSSPMPAAN